MTRIALLQEGPKLYGHPAVDGDVPAIAQLKQYTADSEQLYVDDFTANTYQRKIVLRSLNSVCLGHLAAA